MQTEEQYAYNPDNMRVSRTVVRGTNAGTTTFYIEGQYEEDSNGTKRLLYSFNGRTVAQRTLSGGNGSSNVLVYLHGDHLGSVSFVTNGATGASVSSQEYDPWGRVRSSTGTTPTKLNYTGQRLDDTGLLYYGARYYNPVLGRFTSPDSIVPGIADAKEGSAAGLGYDDRVQLAPLTVDFHEPQFASGVGEENRKVLDKGFRFQLSDSDESAPQILLRQIGWLRNATLESV